MCVHQGQHYSLVNAVWTSNSTAVQRDKLVVVVAVVVVTAAVELGADVAALEVVVRLRSLNDSVSTSNTVLPHGVLYNWHNCCFTLYEILWHCKLAIHDCWHACKLAC